MGAIYKFDINIIQQQYGLDTFIETGTGLGDSLAYVIDAHAFQHIISIEYCDVIYQKAKERFQNAENVQVFNTTSLKWLQENLHYYDNNKCLFWFDAHFPGADYGYGQYNDDINYDLKFPLESEINFITTHRDISNDILIIDDWWLYEKISAECQPDYNSGITRFGIDLPLQSQGMIQNLMSTHKFTIDLRDQGYLICLPKFK